MTAKELREKYIAFFESKGHARISGASLVPENDPSALFTSAGMHPLVPYLMGEPHPAGKRLVNVQKCIRTGDIDEVGDNRHLTFFEMLGNWSLGDYFKKEAINWSWEFLTSKDWLGIDPERIFVTVFMGDKDAPSDEEATRLWQDILRGVGVSHRVNDGSRPVGLAHDRIFLYGRKENWWGPAGKTGPCGPDTEMFFDTGSEHDCAYGKNCEPRCDCGRFIEIWNNVFMQYNKKADGGYEELRQKNVDTGMGVERTVAVLEGKQSVYATELFVPILDKIRALAKGDVTVGGGKQYRALAEHARATAFMVADGVRPSNVDQGYVLRRLIRRAVRYAKKLGIPKHLNVMRELATVVIATYKDAYPELDREARIIGDELQKEEDKFERTLEKGLRIFAKMKDKLDGNVAFDLYQSYGFPLDITEELAEEVGIHIERGLFERQFKAHQEKSRIGGAKRFKGGLADHSEESTKYHTATHLLHKALKDVLGPEVNQKGSNITPERLRFDFNFDRPLTEEEKKKVEDIVNDKIKNDLPVSWQEMCVDDAKDAGAIGLFGEKYGQNVKVYSIGDYSKEICGGPHVEHTGQLGKTFTITSEKSSSAGVRRIKAVLE